MKKLHMIASMILLLSATGCLISEGGRHGHYRGHRGPPGPAAVIVGPPVILVPGPAVRVHVD